MIPSSRELAEAAIKRLGQPYDAEELLLVVECIRGEFDRRVGELIDANNREVDKRRLVEVQLTTAKAVVESLSDTAQKWQTEARKLRREVDRLKTGRVG